MYPYVSVIVPVCNDEKTIGKCLNSIAAQTLREMEVIVINYGSNDSSGLICDKISDLYPDRVSVMHLECLGAGEARNIGITLAQGKYVGFVDATDFISKTMYEEMYKSASEYDADVVVCDVKKVREETGESWLETAMSRSFFTPAEYLRESNSADNPWDKLYRRVLWETRVFPEKIFFENVAVLKAVIADCTRMTYIRKPLYIHNINKKSSIYNLKSVAALDRLTAYKMLLSQTPESFLKEIAYSVAKDFFAELTSPQAVNTADYMEALQELREYFAENELVLADEKCKGILKYLNLQSIPKKIFWANFGEQAIQPHEKKCIESWKEFLPGAELVELNEISCDLNEAPDCVVSAYDRHDYAFVGDYFKLKHVFENGGIAIDKTVLLTSPIGKLRAEKTVFGFKGIKNIYSGIFMSLPGATILKKLLRSYEKDSIYRDGTVSFETRATNLLANQYGMYNEGWTQLLKEDVRVYRADILVYQYNDDTNFAKIYTDIYDSLEDDGIGLFDRDFVKRCLQERDYYWYQFDKLQTEQAPMRELSEKQARDIAYIEGELHKSREAYDRLQNEMRELRESRGEGLYEEKASSLQHELQGLRKAYDENMELLHHTEKERDELIHKNNIQESQLQMYKTSGSWKITAPLRAIAKPFKKDKN